MIIRHLYLQNYRVYEGVTELDVPEGIVGIYGPNGAGKSYLIEAIPWALFGHSRTGIDEVRTTNVNDECIVEISFEHESHLYVIRRSLKGGGKTLKHDAVAHADGLQVATGARDVSKYVQTVIGMNDKGFLASVFAEQKQLAALSAQEPGKRRKLVLDLLGITPIESAVKAARKDAKDADATLKQLQGLAFDLDALATERDDAAAAAVAAEAEQIAADALVTVTSEAAVKAREAYVVISTAIDEGRQVKAQFDKVEAGVQKLEADAAALADAQRQLDALGDTAADLRAAREALDVVERLDKARTAHAKAATMLAKLVPVDGGSAEPPDDTAAVEARRAASAAAETAAGLRATAKALETALAAAQADLERIDDLQTEPQCPTCGRDWAGGIEEVRAHRAEEATAARDAFNAAATAANAAIAEAKELTAHAETAEKALADAKKLWQAAAAAREQHATAVATEAAAADALAQADAAALDAGLAAIEPTDQVASVRLAEDNHNTAQQLTGQLSRAASLATELAAATAERDEIAEDLEQRRADAKAKGYTPAGLEAARQAQDDAVAAADDANQRSRAAVAEVATARTRAQEREIAYERAREQHARIEPTKAEARLLGRLGELLGKFKDDEAASVGPRLAGHARALFSDMTDGTYNDLNLSENFEVRITDQNQEFDLKRFSGSEVDLANLALRIAISECVTLQSGGAVGLMVLDEVFGPLDSSRRQRLLQALNGLQTRFRQVLVVTHADDVKAQLPSSIEVQPIGDRRATALVT